MILGGLQKFSLLDYPDHISAIVFTQGCNFRCQFCYNPMLVWPATAGEVKYEKDHALIEENDFFLFLKDRVEKLQAVVITGGEPTIHKDLPDFIKKIRDLGFKVKLDTNGTNPDMIKDLIAKKLVDYMAMDLKAPEDKYENVVGVKIDFQKIKESVIIIKNSGLPHEFRTTVVPGLIGKEDIEEMGEIIKGADKWFLQKFKSDIDLVNKDYQGRDSFADKSMEEMAIIGKKYTNICNIR